MADPAAAYDELGLFHENALEAGLPWDGPPSVRRESVEVGGGRQVSALVWGGAPADLVLVHGGAQNAHTWDTVALALGRPLVAVDLPGHGRSDWRDDRDYRPETNAEAVAVAVRELAPGAAGVVGMSLGGLTSICLAARHPDLVAKLVVVDVTPGTDREKASPIIAFVSGPESFESFDELLARTIAFNPTRSESSLRRGLLHNARQRDDGRWVWRYDRLRSVEDDAPSNSGSTDVGADFGALWDDVSAIRCPMLLLRGALSQVVGDEDVAELHRRQPAAKVETVEGAGHSIQGDRPVELAAIIERFVFGQ
jgi:pimeloyl-ACP methyl ester carboxylesterase